MLTLERLRVEVGEREIDTVMLGVHRHAGPPAGQAAGRRVLPGRGGRALRRGLQLPARGRRRDEHRRRVRDVVLGARLRRLRAGAGHGHAAPHALARGHRPGAGRPHLAGRRPGGRLAAADTQGADRPARRARLAGDGRHRAGVRGLRRLLRGGRPASHTATWSRPTSTTSTTRSWAPRGSSRCCAGSATRWAGPACTSSRPRASATSASTRSRSATPRPSTTLRQPFDLQDRRQGDRGAGRHEHHVHGQAEPREGNSCHIHLSLRAEDGTPVLAGDGPHGLSELGEHFLAGQLAAMREFTLCYAPNINSYKRYVPGSFAPTSVRWGPDNRTCALRLVGHGSSLRVENRTPGGDVNPYLAVAAMIAAGLDGIDRELPLEPAVEGNAYADTTARMPANLRDALQLWRTSELARKSFGAGGGRSLRQLRPGRAGRLSTPRSPTGSCSAASSACRPAPVISPTGRRDFEEAAACLSSRSSIPPPSRRSPRWRAPRRSRPTPPSTGRPPRRPAGAPSRPVTARPLLRRFAAAVDATSTSWPGWRWPARATRSARPAGRPGTSVTSCTTTRPRPSG